MMICGSEDIVNPYLALDALQFEELRSIHDNAIGIGITENETTFTNSLQSKVGFV